MTMHLKLTPRRLNLMRMICNGELSAGRDSALRIDLTRKSRNGSPWVDQLTGEGVRLNELQQAGLVEEIPLVVNAPSRPIRPTDAGRAWLAEHGG